MSFNEIQQLYQQMILEHNRHPKNYGKLADATYVAEGHNPLCGDHFFIYLKIENNVVTDISFEGKGCAISTASASMMTEVVKGKTIEEVKHLFNDFHELVMGQTKKNDLLGKLSVFQGVAKYPTRVKCAILSWYTVKGILLENKKQITTE
jgi:nitrogen fixation protein NifU and related proteins